MLQVSLCKQRKKYEQHKAADKCRTVTEVHVTRVAKDKAPAACAMALCGHPDVATNTEVSVSLFTVSLPL